MASVVLTLLLATVLPTQADSNESIFESLTVEQASAKAKNEGKLVLLFLTEEDNRQCESYHELVWSNDEIVRWVKDHAVAIELAAKEHPLEAKRYGVKRLPAVVMLSHSGETRNVVEGFRRPTPKDPKQPQERPIALIQELKRALLPPADRVELARAQYARMKDATSQIALATELMRTERYDEALNELLSCLDSPWPKSKTPIGIKLRVIDELRNLGAVHPPATQAIASRRDAAYKRLTEGTANKTDPKIFTTLCIALDDVDSILTAHAQLEKNDPHNAITHLLRECAIESLVEVKRYREADQRVDAVQRFRQVLEQHKSDMRRPAPPGGSAKRFQDFLSDEFVQSTAGLYEILLGAEKDKEANEVASAIIESHPTAKTYHTLAQAGLRTGRASDLPIQHASKAIERSTGITLDMVKTLVLALQNQGQYAAVEEAVKQYANELEDAAERAELYALTAKAE